MSDIKRFSTVGRRDENEFSKCVKEVVDIMQDELLDVEVQYSTTSFNGIPFHSALILGYEREYF